MKPTHLNIRLELFGAPQLFKFGEPLPLSPLQAAALAILATESPDGVPRGRMYELLWRDGSERILRHRLSQALYAIRRTIGYPDAARLSGDRYLLTPDLETDTNDLRSALEENDLARASGIASRGFLAHGFRGPTESFEEWKETTDAAFRTAVRLQAVRDWEVALQRCRWDGARAAAEAMMKVDPDNAEHVRRLAHVLEIEGHHHQARTIMESFRKQATPSEAKKLSGPIPNGCATLRERLHQSGRPGRVGGVRHVVGRREEMSAIRRLLVSSAEPAVRIVGLHGDPGMGKSRLLEECAKQAIVEGYRVLTCRCQPEERRIPLSPLCSIILSDALAPFVARLAPPWRTVIRHFVPEIRDGRKRLPRIDPSSALRRTCESFRQLLRAAGEGQPLLLCLDDVQWADDTTFAVLEYVRRRWSSGALRFVVTLRTGDTDVLRIPSAFRISDARSGTYAIRLNPLSDEDQRRILRECSPSHSFSQATTSAIIALAEGNPYYLLEIARNQTAHERDSPRAVPVPPILADLINTRLQSLSPAFVETLQIIACALAPLPLEVVCAAHSRPQADVHETLHSLSQTMWLDWERSGVFIRHEVARRAILEHLSPGRKRFLTARIVAALPMEDGEGSGAGAPWLIRRAYYLLNAGQISDANALALRAVSAAASSGEYLEVLLLLEQFQPTDWHIRCKTLLARGRIELVLNDFSAAVDRLGAASDELRRRGRIREASGAELLLIRAESGKAGAPLAQLVARCRQVRARAEENGWEELAADALDLQVHMADALRDYEEVSQLIRHAKEMSLSVTDDVAKIKLLVVHALKALYTDGTLDTRDSQMAMELAAEKGYLPLQLRAQNATVMALIHHGQLESAAGIEDVALLESLVSSSGDVLFQSFARMNWAVWHIDTWQYDRAILLLDEVLTDLGETGPQRARSAVHLNLATALLRHHRVAEARRHVDRAMELAPADASASAQVAARSLEGLLALHTGDLTAATHIANELTGLKRPWRFDPTLPVELIALARQRRGQSAEACSIVREEVVALRSRMPLHRLYLLDLLGRLAIRNGLKDDARAAWKEAIVVAHDLRVSGPVRILGARLEP